mgnify:CR=1 FL=1
MCPSYCPPRFTFNSVSNCRPFEQMKATHLEEACGFRLNYISITASFSGENPEKWRAREDSNRYPAEALGE